MNKRKIIPILFVLLLIIGIGLRFADENHYLCDSKSGAETRRREADAKQFPKYPGAIRYTVKGSCGWPDGTPSASIMFYTSDNEEKVFDYYTNVFSKQGPEVKSNEHDMLCTSTRCISYDPRENRADGYKWWNVEIGF